MRGCNVVYGKMELEVLSFTLIMLNVLVGNVCSSGHFENVALHKASSMSSLWDPNRLASAAVNGDTSGMWIGNTNCIHSRRNDQTPWWEVNLGRPYPVFNITVWARTGYEYRMEYCVITVDGEECYRFNNRPGSRNISITCTRGVLNGTTIRVSKNSTQSSDDNTMNMCEFQVFSCSDAYWGNGCTRECGHCSDGEVCDKVTGHCSICSVGWVPPLCDQECANGTFGQNCTQTCSEGCDDVCDKVTGNCSCVPGWNGTLCDSACPPGTHGINCTQSCSVNCNGTCDKATGHCTCKPGFKTSMCTEECANGTFGQNCTQTCSEGCDDVCDKVTGNCSCVPGWNGTLCDSECANGTYGQNCTQTCSEGCDDVCDKVTGSCSCVPGWNGTLCDSAMTNTQTISTGVPAGFVAAVVVALLMVAAVVILVVRLRRAGSKDSMGQDVHISQSFSNQPVQIMTTESPGKPQRKVQYPFIYRVVQEYTERNDVY